MEIIIRILICLISWMNVNYKESGGKETIPSELKHQYHVSQGGEHDWSAQQQK